MNTACFRFLPLAGALLCALAQVPAFAASASDNLFASDVKAQPVAAAVSAPSGSAVAQPKLTATPVFIFSETAKFGKVANVACALGDKLENRIIETLLKHRRTREFLERKLGVEHRVLYRVISAPEAKSLRDNGWAYDLADKRNRYKFAMPEKAPAVKTATACGEDGYFSIIEIETDNALPYYKISQKFNTPKYTDAVNEYIFVPDGTERIRLMDSSEY